MNENPYKAPQVPSGQRQFRPLLMTGYLLLGLAGVPIGFLGIGCLGGLPFALVKSYLAYQKLPPLEPALFALAFAAATAFLMISVLTLFQRWMTNRSLLALWCGTVAGVLLYGVLAILKLLGHF